MKNYAIYISATGKILQTGQCQDEVFSLLPLDAGQAIVETTALASPNDMIVAGAPQPRPLLTTVATWDTLTITANGTTKATLGAGLPNPTTVGITPPAGLGIAPIDTQTVTDGTLTFATPIPGDYVILAQAFPYLDYEVTISGT